MSKGNTVIEVKVGNKIKIINVEIKDSKLVTMAGIAMFIVLLLFFLCLVFMYQFGNKYFYRTLTHICNYFAYNNIVKLYLTS